MASWKPWQVCSSILIKDQLNLDAHGCPFWAYTLAVLQWLSFPEALCIMWKLLHS